MASILKRGEEYVLIAEKCLVRANFYGYLRDEDALHYLNLLSEWVSHLGNQELLLRLRSSIRKLRSELGAKFKLELPIEDGYVLELFSGGEAELARNGFEPGTDLWYHSNIARLKIQKLTQRKLAELALEGLAR